MTEMHSPDRTLVLKVIDGKKPLSSMGVVDPRLFNGENKLRAVMDMQTSLWTLKQDHGAVPPTLKGRFTKFSAAFKHAEDYYKTRNIEIVAVKE